MSIHGSCRIVLADDSALMRRSLRVLLKELDNVVVIGEAGAGLELLHLLDKQTPDLPVIDISMPRLNGIEAISENKHN